MKNVMFYTVVSAIFSGAVVFDLIVSVEYFIEHRYLDFICGMGITILATFAAGYFAGCASRHLEELKKQKNPRVV